MLVEQILDWWTGREEADDTGRRQQLVDRLLAEHDLLLEEQIRAVPAAQGTTAGHPYAAAAAAALQAGDLAPASTRLLQGVTTRRRAPDAPSRP